MTVERANEKSLRVTAIDTDSSEVKIYLIMVRCVDELHGSKEMQGSTNPKRF